MAKSKTSSGRDASSSSLIADAALHLGLGWAGIAVITQGLAMRFDLSWRLPATALALFAPIAVIGLRQVRYHHPFPTFGQANVVTTARAGLTCLFGGLLAEFGAVPPAGEGVLAWSLTGVSAVAICLDGLDGFLARKLALSSNFGARFDTEVDALLIFLMALAAWALGNAGVWVIASGGLRYGFLTAGWIWPALAAELPLSFRRRLVCVVQAGALCLVLSPPVAPPASVWIAAGALGSLIWSFSVDITRLLKAAGARYERT